MSMPSLVVVQMPQRMDLLLRKAPPTRPVAGRNEGMNFPLSELVSWVLEPLASAMEDSGEDQKSNIDRINESNKSWVPAM